MPRMISLAIETINAIKPGKESAGRVYLVLWCHDFGEGFVEVDNPIALAAEAGYSQSEDRVDVSDSAVHLA